MQDANDGLIDVSQTTTTHGSRKSVIQNFHDENLNIIKKMTQEHFQGATLTQIVDRHGWTRGSVDHHINRYKNENNKQAERPTKFVHDLNIDLIRHMVESNSGGESKNSIATRLKLSRGSVDYHISKYRRDHGLP